MRMFVLISRFQQPLEEINHHLAPHSEWVERHYVAGPVSRLRTARTASGWGDCGTRRRVKTKSRTILAADPLQQLGLVVYEVFAFEAAEFPKRSSAFDGFVSQPMGESSPVPETEAQ